MLCLTKHERSLSFLDFLSGGKYGVVLETKILIKDIHRVRQLKEVHNVLKMNHHKVWRSSDEGQD